MDKVFQEFYCNDCNGYIRFKLNQSLNRSIVVVCPNCGRQHPRSIKNGLVYEGGDSNNKEEICPPTSAYSKTAILASKYARDAIKIEEPSSRHPALDALIAQSALDRFSNAHDY